MQSRFAFITGDIMRGEVTSFLEEAKLPYLEKPVSPDELLSLVRDLCEQEAKTRHAR